MNSVWASNRTKTWKESNDPDLNQKKRLKRLVSTIPRVPPVFCLRRIWAHWNSDLTIRTWQEATSSAFAATYTRRWCRHFLSFYDLRMIDCGILFQRKRIMRLCGALHRLRKDCYSTKKKNRVFLILDKLRTTTKNRSCGNGRKRKHHLCLDATNASCSIELNVSLQSSNSIALITHSLRLMRSYSKQ